MRGPLCECGHSKDGHRTPYHENAPEGCDFCPCGGFRVHKSERLSTINPPLFDLAKKFKVDIKKPDMKAYELNKEEVFGRLVQEISDWVSTHREALLLAWFAQYGFEPGKAVLVESHENGETNLYIREATEEEKIRRPT